MKYFILCLFFISACSHKPLHYFENPYPLVAQEIPLGTEFGFVLDGNHYNFGRVTTQAEDIACDYFLGYKNNRLSYQFSTFQESNLIKIFEEKNSLNKKTRALLAEIEKINQLSKAESVKQKTSCLNLTNNRVDSLSYFIVLSPAILLVSPVIIPQMIQNEYFKNDLKQKIKSISFLQTQSEVEKLLGAPQRVQSKEGYKIFSYSWTAYSPIYANYFFEDNKLIGFTVGYDSRPQTVIEQTN